MCASDRDPLPFFIILRSKSLLKQCQEKSLAYRHAIHRAASQRQLRAFGHGARVTDPTFQMPTVLDQKKCLENTQNCRFSMLKHPFWG